MALIKLMLCFLLFCISIGALSAIFVFIVDVWKWHDREERVKVQPSNEVNPNKDYTESEVSDVGEYGHEYNSSAFLGSGLQS